MHARSPRRIAAALAFAALAAVAAATAHAGARGRTIGEVRVVAPLPAPGFPEGVAVKGNRAYVSMQSRSGNAGLGPSTVLAFNTHNGQLARTYTIQGENLAADHSLNGIAFDARHRLYVLSPQMGVIRIDVATGAQDIYAPPVPNLPTCASVPVGTPCSPTTSDLAPLPNDIVFDPAGNAYVTDSFQATIFRIPAGGGPPQIWFQDPRLDGIVGPNGIRLSLDRQHLYFAVSFSVQAAGFVYSLPLIAQPTAGDLTIFHQYTTEGPDDLAVGRSGKVYVSLAVANGVSVLDPTGAEVARYSGPATNGLAFDSPSGVAFGGRSLLVDNHALFSQQTAHMALLSIFVADSAAPLARPHLP